ncbi:MAG: sigma-70 family RNA polymerase sigma factor [Acidobacteriota bacterium]|nr:MAG: sigma-70 family RNA polymerase sigma factor [Acidobacteriota bacterium]
MPRIPPSGEAVVSDPDTGQITQILQKIGDGDPRAADELLPLVYQQLRAAAQQQMARERADHTLQATALVHEAYLRLVGNQEPSWDNRAHFFVAAAEAMRRVLIEHARSKGRIKRGGDLTRVPLSGEELARHADLERIMSVDQAICRLEQRDARMARIVRLRFFAGLGVSETASALRLSDRTVRREWTMARAWLQRELNGNGGRDAR